MTQNRRDIVDAELTPGRIVHVPVSGIDHEKFLVVLTKEPFRALFVNSEIHRINERDPDLRRAQVGIGKDDHGFLDQDSWIDCTTIVNGITRTRVLTEVTADPARLKGKLIPSERAAVLAAIDRGKTLSKFEKDQIFEAFGAKRGQPGDRGQS